MVALSVFSECCFPAERFVTAFDWALVWSLSSVDPTVTGEWTGIAECLPALLTRVWTFTSVYSYMNSQSRSLNERFWTAIYRTSKRSRWMVKQVNSKTTRLTSHSSECANAFVNPIFERKPWCSYRMYKQKAGVVWTHSSSFSGYLRCLLNWRYPFRCYKRVCGS